MRELCLYSAFAPGGGRLSLPFGPHRMNLVPGTQEGWLSLALYPFKVFILAVPLVFVLSVFVADWAGWSDDSRARHVMDSEKIRWGSMCEKGYVVCIIGLFVGRSCLVDKRARRSALIFAVVGLVFAVVLHLGNRPLKTRSIARWPNSSLERTRASQADQSELVSQRRLARAAHAGCWGR